MDFCQRAPPFLIQLQNILRKYPDGGQILKELIQNADDAKATEVIFLYDGRQYGTDSLHSQDLRVIQGPALLAYNNETFTDQDWEGIQKPGNSIKRKDPDTVGRFGLGFNSVYHITDYPAIFSGTNIGFLDPQEEIFHRGGRLWSLQNGGEHLAELSHQFHPFQKALEALGLERWEQILCSGRFNGTLFRFPLRLDPSEISDNIYDSERVQELFESFIKDASVSLLFLRHVTRVSLKNVDRHGKLTTTLSVEVSTEETFGSESADLDVETRIKVTTLKRFGGEEEESKWLVTSSTIQGGRFPGLAELGNKLCNKAALDLAYPLSGSCMDLYGGRLSCILPLPDKEENRTGLPLVINGCFDLTDDRRSLKWPDVDQQHDESAKWNRILVEQVLPLLYTRAICNTVSLVKSAKLSPDEAYGIWPDPEKTQHKNIWGKLTKQMAQNLMKESLLQTVDQSRWVGASEAVFLLEGQFDDQICACLEEVLLLLAVALVKVPRRVSSTLQLATELASVSPPLLRRVLQTEGWQVVSCEKKLALLKFAIRDGRYGELRDLQLLPLADGTFTAFRNTENDGMVYIDSKDFPRILLPGLAHRFIAEDLTEDLRLFFAHVGKAKTFKNLVCLNEEVVLSRLDDALPRRWRDQPDQVNWNPQDQSSPPLQWLHALWAFLQRYPTLDLFENQPIVPLNRATEGSTNVQLARLREKTTLLLQRRDGLLLGESSSALLEKAGCTILREENSWMWHKNLDFYILAPTPNNILKALAHLHFNQVTKVFTEAPKQHLKEFCKVLSQAFSLTPSQLEVLQRLPIFSSAPCITAPSSKLVAAGHLAAINKDTVPTVSDNLMFPDLLIRCRDESDQRLLQIMKIRLLNAGEVALLVAKGIQSGRYAADPAEMEKVMLWILKNGQVLFAQNEQLRNLCRTLSFIPRNGSLKQASALFDPKVDLLNELFEPHHFPPSNYCEDSILASLRQLGMKDSIHKMTPDDVLQIAEALSRDAPHASRLRKAKALIKVCNGTVVLSYVQEKLQRLCNLSWVPAKTHNAQNVFVEPKNLRDMAYRDLVEFSMPLTEDFTKEASTVLGLMKLPPPAKVIESLKVLSQKPSPVDPYSLEGKLHKIYKYIQDHLNQFPENLLSKVMIWNGDGFSHPNEIILVYPEGLDLSAFTKKVPHAFLSYGSLFSQCGVKKTLANQDVVNVLHTLKQRSGDARSGFGTPKDLKLAILILDWMKTNSVYGAEDLPIPVQSEKNNGFSLEPLSKTLFCDIDKQNLSRDFDATAFIVHDEVSMATAKFLNIQLLSTKVLKPEFFEAWGPVEPVTLRIKNILREYSEHSEVFKELLQNADDADAMVCKFLVDRRQNLDSRQTLIDPGMASCHGPALWSYNNSKFTDADFSNITRIGAATKETQAKKIGKFGLGFNTVYHITDVPSILSRSVVIIFDPNVNHLQKHIPSNNPGMKLDLQRNSQPLFTFPGQFKPFIGVFGCNFAQPFQFDGTLIRLPFRTEEEASRSKICQQAFSQEEIDSLLNDFESFADIILLFIKNVEEVELNCLNDGSNPENALTKVHLHKELLERLSVPQTVPMQKEQINASKNLKNMSMQSLEITTSKILKISVRKEASDDENNEKFYLMQSSLGVAGSFQMYMQHADIYSSPVSGLAVPLKKNHITGKWAPDLEDFVGMVFCYLPLPMPSGLPFHINATFAVMPNRKSLWDTTVKGDWNKKLLSDALLVAFITALSQLQILHQNGDLEDYRYYTFWPDISQVHTFFAGAVKSFYQAITFGFGSSLPALVSNGQEWCTLKHACFLQLDFQNESIQRLAKKVFSSVLQKPYLSVSLPPWVRGSLHACGCLEALQNNFYSAERFYKEIVLENVATINAKDRDHLILHAIDLQSKSLDSMLLTKPCIPSSSGGKLQLIQKLIHPMGKVSVLYDPQEGRFPEGEEFLKPERLSRLQNLGMLKDRLPMAELMARANRIQDVWRVDETKALNQIRCILQLLNDLLQQEPNTLDNGEFRDIPFLPAMPPRNKDLTLMKSNGLYHYKHRALVCLVEAVLSKEHLGNVKLSDALLSFLGLNEPPAFPIVLAQLEKACKASNLLNFEEMSLLAKSCYSFLNKQIQKQPNRAEQVKEKASSIPFVYVDDEFVSVKVVAKKLPFCALPYLHTLPKDYETFDKLWACVGICEEFSTKDYLSVLQQMAVKDQGHPLSSVDFQLALNLINHSLKALTTTQSPHNAIDGQLVYIPDKRGVLCHMDKIFYNDTPWIPCEEDLNFCHELVPRAVVSSLGVKTKIHRTLQKLKICSLTKWVSSFGAKEPLTIRIKNIIKEYSSKKDILKELLQNADDSEASEVHFVLDSRTHKTKSTFGKEWNPLQGPALCVYNNKRFDSKDIDGIQQLGIGGKEERLDKTGKFGLGFNSVYHITDCPSFLTGDATLCIFDPNLMFVETATDDSAGGMFAVNNEFKVTFRDVYDTYLPSLFKLEEGTLFRLPLRTASMVMGSKISDQTSSLQDIKNMCQELRVDADNMILFLNHIRKIRFSEITPDGRFEKVFLLESKVDDRDQKELSSFQQKLSDLAVSLAEPSDITPFKVCYRMQISKNGSSVVGDWLVVKQAGTECMDTLDDICGRLKQTMIPQGAVAARLRFPASKGRAFCTLPLPVETGLPVHVNANFIVDSARRDICKEDGDSPKTEWNMFLLSNIIAPLYCCLLQRLCTMISKEKGDPLIFQNVASCDLFLTKFLDFFPAVKESVPPHWQVLVKDVYLTIFKKKAKVIPIYKEVKVKGKKLNFVHVQWSCVGKATIAEEPFFLSEEEYKAIGCIIQNLNMHIAFGGNFLCKELKAAGVPVVELSPQTLCTFLRSCKLLPHGQELPAPVSASLLRDKESCDQLLSYCIKQCASKQVVDLLQGVPLLVTMDGMLRVFDRNDAKFSSNFSELFPEEGHQFAAHQYPPLKECGFLKPLTLENSVIFVKNHLGQTHNLSSSNSKCGLALSKEKETWLAKLWQFFESEIIKLKSEWRKMYFETLVSEYKNWAILPVCLEEKPKILSFAHIKDMVFPRITDVAKCLFRLGFPKLELRLFPSFILDFLLPYLLDPENVGNVLEHLSSRQDLHWGLIENLERDVFLTWILSKLQKERDQKNLNNLRFLPLFETYDGKRQSLRESHQVYVLDSVESLKLLKLSEINPKTLFLKNNDLNRKAAGFLNIPIINEVQLLTKFLLLHLQRLSEKQLLALLELVLNLQRSSEFQNNKEHIFSSLSCTNLIRSKRGALEVVSYFYDHDVRLFCTFGLQDHFIPNEVWEMFKYSQPQFKSLLQDLGLKHCLTEDDVLRFATQVENEAKTVGASKSLTAKAKQLFDYVLSINLDKVSSGFASKVGTIAFIVPLDVQEELKALHPSFAGKNSTVALKGSLLCRIGNENLVWTSMTLIDKCIESKKKLEFLKNCGVLLEVPIEKVIENVKNICESDCKCKLFPTRACVLKSAYMFLQEHLDGVDPRSLEDVPFLLVENDSVLAKPRQIVFELQNDNDFQPYLYKLPWLLVSYSNLFQKVGVEKKASLHHFATVLSTIHGETLDKTSLHANLLKTVSETTQQFFNLLKNKSSNDLQNLGPLYLPATNGSLYESSGLILNDCRPHVTLSELSHQFKFLHSGIDLYSTKNLLQTLPVEIRPRLLSEVTEESIDHFEGCTLGGDCNIKKHFTEMVLSPIFCEGLVCLLRKQSGGKVTQEAAEETCNAIFGKMDIVCSQTLETSLVYKSAPLEGTKMARVVFVKYVDLRCQIYFKHAKLENRALVQVLHSLSKEMNNLMGNQLNFYSLGVVQEMLACKHPGEMVDVLKKNDIWSKRLEPKNAFSLPEPGETIPDEWHDCLDMSVLNTFRVGDYVGYMLPEDDERYLYARVVDVVEAKVFGDYELPMYLIDIGQDGLVEASVLDLYRFKRPQSPKSKALVLLLGRPAPSAEHSAKWFESSAKEIKADIDRQLSRIWQLPEAEKIKAVRRLYLKYHPDKNIGQEELSTEIFKYLQQRFKEMESGGERGHQATANPHHPPRHHSHSSGGFSAFWGKWDREASQHRQHRERFSRTTRCDYDFFHFHSATPRPKPQEAERWLRQAECDLEAAGNDVGRHTEWVFYKAHQAVEKALFAAQHIKKGSFDEDRDLGQLAAEVATYSDGLCHIGEPVAQMKAFGVDKYSTQYPNCHSPPRIPNNGFDAGKEKVVIALAEDILGRISGYVRL